MASNIDDVSINSEYPIAGQDNDSQGFRDNFGIIKNNFVATKSEIEDLQDNTAKKNEANNFLGNNITNANIVNVSEELNAGGTLSSSQDVNFTLGPVQTFTVGGDITLTTTDWPESGKVGKVRLILINDGEDRILTIGTEAGSSLKFNARWPNKTGTGTEQDPYVFTNNVTIDSDSDPVIIDFMTYNQGSSIFVDYIGKFY
jgi:hypothetical protein